MVIIQKVNNDNNLRTEGVYEKLDILYKEHKSIHVTKIWYIYVGSFMHLLCSNVLHWICLCQKRYDPYETCI
jgi:hypothetical protein